MPNFYNAKHSEQEVKEFDKKRLTGGPFPG